jgi:cellulose synthase/poly-beta-1,6-N-acetylglucosamine synthase-like glycosyltransferase
MHLSTVVFLASVVFVLYVLIIYPAALAFFAKRFARPIRKELHPAKISIIVPVRNGARWIQPKLDSLLASEYPAGLIDVLVASDGSTDGTNELVANYPDARVRLLALPPGGKATAVTRALAEVNSPILVFTDVRQTFDPQAIPRLIACFADPRVGVVTGELIIREGSTQEEFNTGLYWKYEKWIRRNLNRIDAMLGVTGSIYAARREAMGPIPAEILLDDVYVPFLAVSRGFRIYFEDEAKAYDLPTSLQSEFRRKVRTQAGVYQIIRYFPWLLWPGNRRFIHFLSHKFGRLLLPFALIAAFVSSFGLPEPWRWLALAAQILFYGAAIIDAWLPESFPLKRLTAPIRAFVVLIAAAFCALSVFFMPARTLWKETQVSEVKPA